MASLENGSSSEPRKVKRAGLNRLHRLRYAIIDGVRWYYTRFWGMDLHPTCQFSLSTKFDKTWPRGVHVGADTYIAFDVRVLAHDMPRGLFTDTRIGARCFIGGCTIIMPGVEIGDDCVIGAGSVVTRSIPPGSIAAGNPARVLRSGLSLGRYGRLPEADANEAAKALEMEGA
ncbi:acyltransferase [Cereibacter sphaeroides]|uniref:acyltransferase n=1 Tax=Cereibacter sphaeroides TaxID=1063 RepID=UPI002D7E2349|nr:acyltransferase [Cereibacter sphaeroides]